MNLSRRGLLIGATAMIAAPMGRAATTDVLDISGPAFGARWHLRSDPDVDAMAVAEAVMGVVRAVDDSMSPFRPSSEISLFNARRSTDWQALSGGVTQTLLEARRVARLTGGAFDPTLGAIVARYGFGPIRQPQIRQSQLRLAPNRPEQAGAFQDMQISTDGARKAQRDQTLDLCGIAKGHALDRIIATLAALGLRNALVELGGEVRAIGAHPEGRDWRIGVEHPLGPEGAIWHRLSVSGAAIATSGDQHNSYLSGTRRYGHIIDPRARRPAQSPLTSVTTIARRAVSADALATALFALGAEAGPALAQDAGIAALFLIRDGAGLRQVITGDYATRITA